MDTLNLLYPLWLIPAMILFVLAVLVRVNIRTDDWAKVMSASVLQYLRKMNPKTKSTINWSLLAAAVCALALSSPATRVDTDNTLLHSTTWIVLLDVSRSMNTDDVAPTRLSAARNTLLQLSRAANSRSLGLIIYSGDAYLASPPAFDKRLFNETAALLDHGIVPHEGSNLSRALSLASSVVSDSQLIAGRIFLLTDSGGVNNTSTAAARHLRQQGQRLDVVVFGSATGDPNIAVNIDEVEALANAGGGEIVRASSFGEVDLDALKLDAETSGDFFSANVTALYWKIQSHWLLLLLLPVLIQIFRVERNQ